MHREPHVLQHRSLPCLPPSHNLHRIDRSAFISNGLCFFAAEALERKFNYGFDDWPLDTYGKSKGVQGDNTLTVKTMATKKAELPEIRES
jgi:hypothetical protein